MNIIRLLRSLFNPFSLFPFGSDKRGGSQVLFACWLLFVYTVFSGALRKWVVGSGQLGNVIFILQLLSPFVFAFIVVRSRSRVSGHVPVLFVIYIIYIILCAFNPKNHTLFHGLFGLMIHLGLWLGLLVYLRRREAFELEKLLLFFIVVLTAEVILGSIQYALPQDHILNIKGNGRAIDAFVGEAVRVSGTFSYIGGYQVMVTFYGFLIWFLVILDFPFFISAIVLGLSIYAALMSGSRGSLLMLLFVSGFALVQSGYLFKKSINVIVTCVILGLSVVYLGSDFIKSFDQAYENFSDRVDEGIEKGETESRFEEPFRNVLEFNGKYPIFGIGLGSTYQGANIMFGESFYSKEFGGYEGEPGRIILEGGFILFFLRWILMIAFLRRTYIPNLGQIVIFIVFFFSVVIFNTYQAIFFMFGVMLVDRAYYLRSQGAKLR